MGNAVLNLDQYALFETPEDHINFLHNKKLADKKPGNIIAWTPKNENRKWQTFTHEEAPKFIPSFVNQADVYVTPNAFYGWRTIKNLHTLQALFIDIDLHDLDFSLEENILVIPELVEDRLDRLVRAKIPEPNCIVYSGRGVHFYWLINPTHPNALPRWQACQRRLVDVCGADKQSADATRVLRLVGSTNSKVDNFTVRAEERHKNVFDFDWLHDQVMPLTREEHKKKIRDINVLRANKGLKPVRNSKNAGSIYARWYLVYQDLLMIIECQISLNEKGPGLPAGMRDLLLYHLANALSWFTISDALENEVVECARKFTPSLSYQEALSYCSSVINRAKKTKVEGKEHRYRYKRETLYRELKDLIPESIQPKLRAIIPNELARERKIQQIFESRRAIGVVERKIYLSPSQKNKNNAEKLKSQGLKYKEIALKLNLSIDTIKGYFRKK
ncbi:MULTISPECIES: DNA-primase RepB domain-containing protein [unclassified Acinetobacter]|uniref:DNA-primase RepB domain-containing protein n=1 Tax=unclassified Acinetobacter TaxID=196816 RepID=UPI0015D1B754|nr:MULTISPECIES: DNA-primase RepB domain-containing protein [unclassified Acinetobacter]UUS62507.1 RepB family DNA primase [Acinetobacter sp. YH16056_T]